MTEYNVPCKVPLNGCTNGNTIKIKGTVRDVAESFTVQLDFPEGIAFQMKAEGFDKIEPEVKCNSKLKGKWGEAEVYRNPFQQGTGFVMTLIDESNLYNILVGGRPVFSYTYRYPDLAKINCLQVTGDLDTKVYISVE